MLLVSSVVHRHLLPLDTLAQRLHLAHLVREILGPHLDVHRHLVHGAGPVHLDAIAVDLGHGVRVSVKQTKTGWCTVALTVLEGESFERGPARVLLAATGYTENTGMGWKDESKSTVGTNWGKPPSLVEPVAATIRLAAQAAAPPAVYALNDRGQRGAALTVTAKEGGVEVEIGPASGTLWYEIVFPPAK